MDEIRFGFNQLSELLSPQSHASKRTITRSMLTMDEEFPGHLLHQACLWGNYELLNDLLCGEQIEHINSVDSKGRSALHAAVSCDSVECVQILLNNGADPNVTSQSVDGVNFIPKAPLHIAAENGNFEIVKLLIDYKADVLAKDGNGFTPMDIAEQQDHFMIMKILKQAVDELEAARHQLFESLSSACSRGSYSDVKYILEELDHSDAELIVNTTPSGSNTLLFKACQDGHRDIVELLLNYGADGRVHPVTRYSPLYISSYHGRKDIVEMLLIKFPKLIQVETVEKWLPIHAAAINNHIYIIEMLLDKKFYPQEIMMAFQWFDNSGQHYQYEMPFDINAQDATGQTVLYLGSLVGNQRLIDFLLKYKVEGKLIQPPDGSPTKSQFSQSKESSPTKSVSSKHLSPTKNDFQKQNVVSPNILSPTKPNVVPSNLVPTRPNILASKDCDTNCDDNSFDDKTNVNVIYKFPPDKSIVSPMTKSPSPMIKSPSPSKSSHSSSSKRFVKSPSIQKLIDQLSPSSSGRSPSSLSRSSTSCHENDEDKKPILISPIKLDVYCNHNTETALHAAIKKKHYPIASALLLHGANPNLVLITPNEEDQRTISTALKEACLNRDASMVDLLVRYGARDDDCLALKIASQNGDNHLISKILSLKAHPDPEYKINKKALQFNNSSPGSSSGLGFVGSVTFSSMFPTVSVMINWHSLKGLTQVRKQWLVDAAVAHNIKLKLNIQNQVTAITAITRLDLSTNELNQVPLCIFQMHSLKILNLSQNKLKLLPETESDSPSSFDSPTSFGMKKSKSHSSGLSSSLSSQSGWLLPCLEELYLQENQLETISSCVFDLPSLQLLDLSSNKLHRLPYKMWLAPKLRELNASFNLIKDLPSKPEQESLSSSTTSSPLSPVKKQKLKRLTYKNQNNNVKVQTDKQLHGSQKLIGTDKQFPSSQISGAQVSRLNSGLKNLKEKKLKHVNLWSESIEVLPTNNTHLLSIDDQSTKLNCSKLVSINLSHNSFTKIPSSLSCLAINLMRLNLSYNCLTSLGYVKNYPVNLKHVDLSQNQITEWFTIHYHDKLDQLDAHTCYDINITTSKITSDTSTTNKPTPFKSNAFCTHKQHVKLENLRTLILSNNKLTQIKLSAEDSPDDGIESVDKKLISSKLLFPNLSMLDVANNSITEIPVNICDLTNLSVINLNGNYSINYLPPEMGLLNKLWNLSTRGCNLNEPLKTMIESKKYKTMDIIGYLRSILENSKTYARIKLMIVGVQGIGKTSLLEQLRLEGTGSYKKKPPEHWGKRIGNKNMNIKTPKGVTLSTVGVDVNDWTYEKRIQRGQTQFGPVTFRTWDFGGQREYYATHQYFLSRRSLYLVVWKITDGEKGVDGIFQWLVNIQARAPGAPVLIVGTHYDLIKDQYPSFYSEELQQQIRERFINVIDPDKCGLPRVIDTIEVSIKTKHNIKLLCNLIYDTVMDLRCPGSKERLLEQKIPATYLALEDLVSHLAYERKLCNRDPVLRADQYRDWVMEEMLHRFGMTFRDVAELNQATSFLHENGVLLHYEDSSLKDLYFLDPQWLCDMLAHVVTIREINPYAKNGIMKTDDLKQLFKNSSNAPSDAQTYILNLLNKFEVALTWDSRTLLIPSLLPTEEHIKAGLPGCEVKIPVRSRTWGLRKSHYTEPSRHSSTPSLLSPSTTRQLSDLTETEVSATPKFTPKVSLSLVNRPKHSIQRLLLMTYFPSGFWSRLITRILADDLIIDVIRSYFVIPKDGQTNSLLLSVFNSKAEWFCWQTGLSLRHFDTFLIRIKEVMTSITNSPYDYYHMKFMIQQEDQWTDLNINKSSLLEIYLPNQCLNVQTQNENGQVNNYLIEPNQEFVAKLLAIAVDHMDTLLEDWYPTLGTRFVHTSEGKFLVTRLVPCNQCLINSLDSLSPSPQAQKALKSPDEDWQLIDAIDNLNLGLIGAQRQIGSHDSVSSRDSGMGMESTIRRSTDEFHSSAHSGFYLKEIEEYPLIYSFLVEECILSIYGQDKTIRCPLHGQQSMESIAPDTAFVDLGDYYLIKPQDIRYGKLLGRGAFGFVFRATIKQKHPSQNIDVAMKMLQPVDPKVGAKQSDLIAYKAATHKWQRDPIEFACKAYCTARQELNILMTLRHQNIVPLIGLCTKPLALVLRLAPLGSLDTIIKNYRRSGVQFSSFVIQKVILQIAKAIEYLHQQHIIYRDLKSENVLVWEIPLPYSFTTHYQNDESNIKVDVKLADYGISRSTLPTGTKGFGGTEGFMAPEIMRYNGEEEYNEKVDVFSFGMFMYELLTLRLPFENQECVKEHILDGGRPVITPRDLLYPNYFIDLMTICWSQQSNDRPSSSQIVSIISAPEFNHLLDTVSLEENYSLLTCCGYEKSTKSQFVLVSEINKQTELLQANGQCWTECHEILSTENLIVTTISIINNQIWLGDSKSIIHIYSIENYNEIDMIYVDGDDDTPTAIKCIIYLPSIEQVAITSSSGRLWLCSSSSSSSSSSPASEPSSDSKWNLKEIGNNGIPFLCLINVLVCDESDQEDIHTEVWCGQTEGSISIISLPSQGMIQSQYFVNHYDDENELQQQQTTYKQEANEKFDVFQLISDGTSYVWSYLYPDCFVYQWNVYKRMLINKLDCSKLAPCSESLMSISIEEHFNAIRCQVTTMNLIEGQMELYIGTNLGCIIIVEARTLRPIIVFRPFEGEIKAILSFKRITSNDEQQQLDNQQSIQQEQQGIQLSDHQANDHHLMAAIGKGYRSLLTRYFKVNKRKSHENGIQATIWSTQSWYQN